MPLGKDDIVYAGNNVYGKNVANNTVELAKLLHEKVYDNYVNSPTKSWVVCLDDVSIDADRVKMNNLPELVIDELKKLN